MLKRRFLAGISMALLLALVLAPVQLTLGQTEPTVTVTCPTTEVERAVGFDIDSEASNPADGTSYGHVRFRITLDGPVDFTGYDRSDVFTITHVDGSTATEGVNDTFSVVGGDFVGYWGPAEGFPFPATYEVNTTFTLEMSESPDAPGGTYTVTCELIDLDNGSAVLATDSDTFDVAVVSPTVTVDCPVGELARDTGFDISSTAENPRGGVLISGARFRLTLDGPVEFDGDPADIFTITDVNHTGETQGVNGTFSLVGGDFVGYWGPAEGFPMSIDYPATTVFTVEMNGTTPAPGGEYSVLVELIDVDSDNEVLASATDTFDVQAADPAVLVDCPDGAVQRATDFTISSEADNPLDGAPIEGARFRITLDGPADFAGDRQDVFTITEVDGNPDTQGINNTFSLDSGDFVGYWGPAGGFLMDPGYEDTTDFTVQMSDSPAAPAGTYTVTVELIDVSSGSAVLDSASDTFEVEALAPEVTVSCPDDEVGRVTAFDIVADCANPDGGAAYSNVRFDITLSHATDFTGTREGVFTITDVDDTGSTQGINDTFSLVGGDFVGFWGPAEGFAMGTGYAEDTTFTVQLNGTSPCYGGVYTVTVDLVDVNTSTVLASGSDTFTVTKRLEGDVNGDGMTNIVDAMFVAQYTVGIRSFHCDQLVCGDTTDDGATNIVDAMHIAQFTVDPNMTGGVLFKPLWETGYDQDFTSDPLA